MGDSKTSEGESIEQPSWLTKELIQQALHNSGDETSLVAAISLSRAAPVGDNYASAVYRVRAILPDGSERSFIVKGPAPGDMIAVWAKESGIFVREITMLTEVVPKMQALLEEAAPGRFPPLAPRCFLSGSDPVEFLVVEDLGLLGFRTADRKRGLGLRHALFALRTLARFHAASYALLERQPDLAEKLDNKWTENFASIKVFLDIEFQTAADVCRKWPGFEQYGERLEKFKEVAFDKFAEANVPKPGEFNVITHSDFWVNNMLFSYADGAPSGHRAIDLQISHVASPVLDILYFLAGSVTEDVHTHHQDLLLREYYVELKATLELLGHQAPTLESLLEAFEAHGCYSLFIAMGFPIMKAEVGVDFNAILKGDSSSLTPLFDNPFLKRWFQRILPDYARRGWLPE